MRPIATEFCFTARVELAAAETVGDMSRGIRCFVPIQGGTVHGPRLSGSIVAAGGDWQVIVMRRLVNGEA